MPCGRDSHKSRRLKSCLNLGLRFGDLKDRNLNVVCFENSLVLKHQANSAVGGETRKSCLCDLSIFESQGFLLCRSTLDTIGVFDISITAAALVRYETEACDLRGELNILDELVLR